MTPFTIMSITLSLVKAAPYLLPFVKPLAGQVFDLKDGPLKDYFDASLDLVGDRAKDKIKEFLKLQPDAADRLLDQHFIRHTGEVLGTLVKRFAREQAAHEHRDELIALGKAAPEGWIKFIAEDACSLGEFPAQELPEYLAAALVQDGCMADVDASVFAQFFRWLAVQEKLSTPLKRGVTPELVKWISLNLDAQLLIDLCKETLTANAAWKDSMLRILLGANDKLNRLDAGLALLHQKQDSMALAVEETRHSTARIKDTVTSTADAIGGLHLKLDAIACIKKSPGFDLDAYAIELTRHCDQIPFAERADARGGQTVTLTSLFVTPDVRAYPEMDPRPIAASRDVIQAVERGDIDTLPESKKEQARRLEELQRQSPPRSAFDVIFAPAERGHVVLAHAGVGKSSLVRRICLLWAASHQGESVSGPSERIPLLIELKHFAGFYETSNDRDLLDFIENSGHSLRKLARAQCEHLLRADAAILILDGLDEVRVHDTRKAIARLAGDWLRSGARIVITSRREGFVCADWQGCQPAWSGWLLQEFTPQQRTQFIDNMYHRLCIAPAEREERVADLKRRIIHQHTLALLSPNPLLLTLVCVLHHAGKLGNSRLLLYKAAAEELLDSWDARHFQPGHEPLPQGIICDARTRWLILRRLALKLVSVDPGTAKCFGENLFGRELLEESIREIFDPTRTDSPEANHAAEHLPRYLHERHSVICYAGHDSETQRDLFSFFHRTFLEYFAGLAWAQEVDNRNADDTSQCLHFLFQPNENGVPRWRDERYARILPFYFGLLNEGFHEKRIQHLLTFGETVPKILSFQHEATLFVASCIAEIPSVIREHPVVASEVLLRLTALAESARIVDIMPQTLAEPRREQCRRAVRMIAQTWGDTEEVRVWLWREARNEQRTYVLRAAIIRELATMLGQDEHLQSLLDHLLKTRREHDWVRCQAGRTAAQFWPKDDWVKHRFVVIITDPQEHGELRMIAIQMLGQMWSMEEWLRELLVPLCGQEEKDREVRCQAIETMGQVWGAQEWLRELLVPLCGDEKEYRQIRSQTIKTLSQVRGAQEWLRALLVSLCGPNEKAKDMRCEVMATLGQVWGKQEWLRELLVSFCGPNEKEGYVRAHAIVVLGKVWGAEDWLREFLVPLCGMDEKDEYVRAHAVATLGQVWGAQDWLRALLVQLTGSGERNGDQRFQAIRLLGQVWGAQDWLRALLVSLCESEQEAVNVRIQAIETLGQVWGAQEWLRVLLTRLCGPEEKNENVRCRAIGTLGQVWGAQVWLRELLTRLFGPEEMNGNVRCTAISTLGQIWGAQDWLRELLMPLCGPEEQEKKLRSQAIVMMGWLWGTEDWLRELLVPLCGAEEQDENVRTQAIETLSEVWRAQEWLRALLVPLCGPDEKNVNVQRQAVGKLREFWPDEAENWLD